MSQQTQLPVETLHSTAKPPARLRKLPFYPALAALFALLSVYAFNTDEASPRELLVPAAVVLAATLLLLAIATLALRGMHRAAPPVAAAVFFFLTYGNRVDILWALHPDPRRRTLYHQTVFILQTVLILLITYTAARRLKHPHRLTPRLNELVLFLVTCPPPDHSLPNRRLGQELNRHIRGGTLPPWLLCLHFRKEMQEDDTRNLPERPNGISLPQKVYLPCLGRLFKSRIHA